MIGKVVGNSKITEKVGVGGFGTVYKGIQINLNREVAIKVLHPQYMEDPNFVEKFQAEAKILATLNHPNIIQVYDIVQEEKTYFIIMEYVTGKPLKNILNKKKRLPVDEAVKIALDVGHALAYTHQKNIIHRDIKPANIMVTEEGISKVMDFGIAKAIGEASESFTKIGSFAYASPEQMNGEPIDTRTDIYALGVTLDHMVRGTPSPQAHGTGTPSAPEVDIPEGLSRVIQKASAPKKEERYVSISEFLEALKKSAQEETIEDKT